MIDNNLLDSGIFLDYKFEYLSIELNGRKTRYQFHKSDTHFTDIFLRYKLLRKLDYKV